ncbi:MAG: nucleoside kinase [Peptococcaceae bacterium]|nr:nucleoside kinase [Peptococcaceae bacterium]
MTSADNQKNGNNLIRINVINSGEYDFYKGSRAIEAIKYYSGSKINMIVAVRINNSLEDLQTKITEDSTVEFVDLESEDGKRIYQSGLILVLNRAVQDILPGSNVIIEHSLSNAIYGEIRSFKAIKEKDIAHIENRMKLIIDGGGRITRAVMIRDEAIRFFKNKARSEKFYKDKVDLLSYWGSDPVEIVGIGDYYDYSLGPVIPSLSILKVFRLRLYLPGFIIEMPRKEDPLNLPIYEEQGKLSTVFYEAGKWRKILKVSSSVALNHRLASESPGEFIRVVEAFQEKKINQLSDEISKNIDRIRIILIAGPSSSGKTTFAKRLSTYLKVNGINPVSISLDDYFLDREHTPKDEKGEYDFESLEAFDSPLFNEHLNKLIQGEEIEIPNYNFITGKRQYTGNKFTLDKNDLIIVEGIHGINDAITSSIPKGRKYKIYISALTHLNLDFSNRIQTTDLRLLRRIVRDNNFRGFNAERTLKIWPSVRRGEEKHIFPFQENADMMFNSSLIYELSVLKGYVEPLLEEITRDKPQYSEARRLLRILSFFDKLDSSEVPANSILREYIGDSCFYPEFKENEIAKGIDKPLEAVVGISGHKHSEKIKILEHITDWVDVLMPPRF